MGLFPAPRATHLSQPSSPPFESPPSALYLPGSPRHHNPNWPFPAEAATPARAPILHVLDQSLTEITSDPIHHEKLQNTDSAVLNPYLTSKFSEANTDDDWEDDTAYQTNPDAFYAVEASGFREPPKYMMNGDSSTRGACMAPSHQASSRTRKGHHRRNPAIYTRDEFLQLPSSIGQQSER
ncbi:hypothetical protein MMC13_008248 [Lambiella insularis]|nr:hypothetical protein [Lambiella insularis]